MDGRVQRGQPRGELHQPGRSDSRGMRLRLSGTKVHEESDPKRHGRQPRTVPVPRLFTNSGIGYAGQPERASDTAVGPSGTGGHPPPGPRAGRFPVLLRRGLQQECHRSLRRTGNDRGSLRLLPLWGRNQYGQPRPARPVVRRDARRRTRPGLLQLPLLQPQRRQVDQPRSHR